MCPDTSTEIEIFNAVTGGSALALVFIAAWCLLGHLVGAVSP